MIVPFLSIVTISFNQAKFLRQTIESVLSQKPDDVEYIVVDPGSTDGSREVLSSYGNAIDHLILEPDEGPADGLNKGFALATGRVGYFLNSDDFLLPGSVARMRALWQHHIYTDLMLCGGWMVDASGQPLRELPATNVSVGKLLDGRASLVQQGMSFRMDRFHATGGFNKANRTCWDYELLCDLVHRGAKTKVVADRIGAFRIHETSITSGAGGSIHAARYAGDIDRIYRKMTNRPVGSVIRCRRYIGPVMKYLGNPGLALDQVRRRLPGRSLADRWSADFNRLV